MTPATDGISPGVLLENVRSALRLYCVRFGENPVGSNPEIASALTGGNPRQVVFIGADDGLKRNDRGEMVDPWGRPLFFHQLSGTQMEIRSAGPDRILWTSDDLTLK